MLRNFILLTQMLWFSLAGLFVWLCFYHWTNNSQTQSNIAFCGTMALENERRGHLSAEIEQGKQLFRANCAACHAGDMKTPLTGPPLLAGLKAWSGYPQADLFAFIRDSQGMIAAEHPRAKIIWEEYRPTVMNSFKNISDEELAALVAYINYIGN